MKKFILLIVAILCLHFDSFAATSFFADTNEHWAEEYTETLKNLDILKGEGNFAYPDRTISRGEFCALVSRAFLKVDKANYNTYFIDVDKDDIFAPYISTAFEAGIVNGIGENKFGSEKNITREEITLMISRIKEIPDSVKNVSFKDIKSGYRYYYNLKKVYGNNIIDGYNDNTFRPFNYATRGEVAKMIVKAMECVRVPTQGIDSFSVSVMSDMSDLKYYTGQARSDREFIDGFKQKSNISEIKKEITSPKITATETKGMLSKVNLQSDISYSTGKKYIQNTTFEIINKNGELKIYNYDINLSEKNKINLTWEVYNKAPSYAPKSLTHISPSAFVLAENNNGSIVDIGLGKIKLYNTLTKDFLSYAKTNNYSVWAMYKTDFKPDIARSVLTNTESRHKIIAYIAAKCIENNISGINFDFENMYKTDAAIYANHVKEMSLIMHEIGVVVSADITRYEKTSAQWSMCYDRDKLAKYCDYIMLMAYDQYYAGSKTPGPVAGLDWVEDSINITLKEVDNDKLILGIPYYIRYWESKNNTVMSTKAISMETAQKLIKENNVKMEYISSDGQYKVYWQKGDITCSFWLENSDTIRKRYELAKKYSLPGIASWRRGLETIDIWDVF